MGLDLQAIYDFTDVSGKIHAKSRAWSAQLRTYNEQVSSSGQTAERPASKSHIWATRALATAATCAIPPLQFAAGAGAVAVFAFGAGRDVYEPYNANPFKHGMQFMAANGVIGLPERGAARVSRWAADKGRNGLAQIFMGVAICLRAVAQFVRVPAALADGVTQMLAPLAAAALGIVSRRYHKKEPQAA